MLPIPRAPQPASPNFPTGTSPGSPPSTWKSSEADTLVDRFRSNRDLHVVKVILPYNNLWAVDFTQFGVDKAAATLELSRMIGVGTGDMVAAGDSYNDMPLLQLCGLGIAMGDAPDELKAIADYVAPPVEEDGLAVAIEQFIMPRL